MSKYLKSSCNYAERSKPPSPKRFRLKDSHPDSYSSEITFFLRYPNATKRERLKNPDGERCYR